MSPAHKALLPRMAAHYGFDIEFVTYKWPSWLRKQARRGGGWERGAAAAGSGGAHPLSPQHPSNPSQPSHNPPDPPYPPVSFPNPPPNPQNKIKTKQTEKQRIIWAYKILFLDALFPQTTQRVIFVDSDQVVRTDLRELATMDIQARGGGFGVGLGWVWGGFLLVLFLGGRARALPVFALLLWLPAQHSPCPPQHPKQSTCTPNARERRARRWPTPPSATSAAARTKSTRSGGAASGRSTWAAAPTTSPRCTSSTCAASGSWRRATSTGAWFWGEV